MSNESNSTASTPNLDSANLLVLLFKWRKPLMIVTIAAVILSSAVSLMITPKFKSTVTLFATRQHSFGEQLLEEVKKEDVLAYGEEEDAERLMQLINSDQIRNRIIEKYDLWTVYKINRTDAGANTLIGKEYNENVTAKLTKFGSIEISVLDADANRARDMANDVAAYTDSVSNKIRSERAMDAFKYAEASVINLEKEIAVMEDSMKVLQEMGVYNYTDQVAALVEQYGTAIAEGHPDRANQIKVQLDFLSQYGTLFNKLESKIEGSYEKLNVVKKRFDLMKIDVDSNLSSKFVVDDASAADKKSYPIRWLIVAMSTISAFVFAVIFLLIWDNIVRLRSEGRI
ncbi:MAG: Wzz/FepE/Etk N-terminal domain-containing protein [Flavobacteriales bacterium]|jgi:uncharacterized protein involved in exopolysaccharide biosynthesis